MSVIQIICRSVWVCILRNWVVSNDWNATCLRVHILDSYKEEPPISKRLYFFSLYSCTNIYRSDFCFLYRHSRSAILLPPMDKKDTPKQSQQILLYSLQMWLFVRYHHLCMFNTSCTKKHFSASKAMLQKGKKYNEVVKWISTATSIHHFTSIVF